MRVIGFAGWSGAGKTTLLKKLIPALRIAGYSVSTIKHAHHDFDIDVPGKDTWEHRQAGASEVLVGSCNRWALMHELRGETEPNLSDLLKHLSPVDFVLVEGFRHGAHPKIEVHRRANGKPLMFLQDTSVVAIVSDEVLAAPIPQAFLDDILGVTSLVLAYATSI